MSGNAIYKDDFAIIFDDNYFVVLDTISNKMFRIKNEKVQQEFKNHFEENGYESEFVKREFEKVALKRENTSNCKSCSSVDKQKWENPKEYEIGTLVLVLTSKCNLRCRYCYANHGLYNFEDDSDMTEQTLINTLDYFTKNFKSISRIHFFGGEPTLKEDLIFKTVEYFNKNQPDNKPEFGFVTNGVHLSDSLLDLMVKEEFGVTISLDGAQDINDSLRINCNNDGSFKNILDTFNRLKSNGLKVGIECTYTAEHVLNNISLVSLVEYFAQNFDSPVPHIAPVFLDSDNELSLEKYIDKLYEYLDELVDYTFENVIEGKEKRTISVYGSLLSKIITKDKQDVICPVGLHHFSVAKDSKITPCFLYTSDEDTTYGSVGDDCQQMLKNMLDFNQNINTKSKAKECQQCFAKGVCSSCLGVFEIKNKIPVVKDRVMCMVVRKLVEKSYLKLAEIYQDAEKAKLFETNIKK